MNDYDYVSSFQKVLSAGVWSRDCSALTRSITAAITSIKLIPDFSANQRSLFHCGRMCDSVQEAVKLSK